MKTTHFKDVGGLNFGDRLYSFLKKRSGEILFLAVPHFRRAFRFLLLPYCYFFLVNWSKCDASRVKVFWDMLYIFFRLRYYPDNYFQCKLYKKPRSEWAYYYGSIYEPFQRFQLRDFVHPAEYEVLYEDKWVCQILCEGKQLRVPPFVGIIPGGPGSVASLKSLLSRCDISNGLIIAKPINGKGGHAIHVLQVGPGNDLLIAGKEFSELGDSSFPCSYIVQRYIDQHPDLKSFSKSVNTTRLVTMLTKEDKVIVIGAYIRFSGNDGLVDNLSQGGLAVKINVADGSLDEFGYDRHGNSYSKHPVSQKVFKDFSMPHWDQLVQFGMDVQRKLGFSRLLGMDIAVTPDGPLLIEINSTYDNVDLEEICGPILRNEEVLMAFNDYHLLINDEQKGLIRRRSGE